MLCRMLTWKIPKSSEGESFPANSMSPRSVVMPGMNPSTPTAMKARPKSSARVCASERLFMSPPWVVAAPASRSRRPVAAELVLPATAGGLDGACERVADGRTALFVAAREPAATLLRGSVRPGLGIRLSLRLLLDAVIANCVRCVEGLVDVGLRQLFDQPRLDRVGRPDAGEAIGLELRSHRTALGSLGVVSNPVENAELVLDVVPVLVRDHVGLR